MAHAWLIDPEARTLEHFALESGRWTLRQVVAGEHAAKVAPFDALEIALSRLWSR